MLLGRQHPDDASADHAMMAGWPTDFHKQVAAMRHGICNAKNTPKMAPSMQTIGHRRDIPPVSRYTAREIVELPLVLREKSGQ